MVMHSKVILVAAIIIGGTGAAEAQDAAAGAAVFKTQCSICHSVIEGKNMVGPSLFGVVGRQGGRSRDSTTRQRTKTPD